VFGVTGSRIFVVTDAKTADQRPALKPLDPPMTPFAVGGMVLWGIAALVLLALRHRLHDAGHGTWLPISVAGVLWGLPGLATMLVHDRNRRRRRAAAAASAPLDHGSSGTP
jgi:hypothetical protein